MDRPDETTHFGFRDVPLGDKQTLVNDVFHSVAQRYDLMNDLMSAGLHRVWKDLMINALNPPRGDAPFALLDVAGGTGDIAFRAAKAAGPGFQATVCDINSDMLDGRPRARRGAPSRRSGVVCRRQCRGAGVSRPQLSTPTPSHSASATCRGSIWRLSEAFRVLQARQPLPVPGIFHRRRARPRSDLRSVFVQGDSAARPRRDRRRRILSISRRIDPQISQARTRLPR